MAQRRHRLRDARRPWLTRHPVQADHPDHCIGQGGRGGRSGHHHQPGTTLAGSPRPSRPHPRPYPKTDGFGYGRRLAGKDGRRPASSHSQRGGFLNGVGWSPHWECVGDHPTILTTGMVREVSPVGTVTAALLTGVIFCRSRNSSHDAQRQPSGSDRNPGRTDDRGTGARAVFCTSRRSSARDRSKLRGIHVIRFIPACAGNTVACAPEVMGSTLDPRVRGEHL